jgi:hypothetical protein
MRVRIVVALLLVYVFVYGASALAQTQPPWSAHGKGSRSRMPKGLISNPPNRQLL